MGKRSVRICILVCLLAVSSIVFAQGTTESTKEKDGTTKITVWTDDAASKDFFTQKFAEYNATIGKEKGIEVEYTTYGTNFNDVLKIAMMAGEAPDIFRPDGKYLRDHVMSGFVAPLEDMPRGQALISKYTGSLGTNDQVFDGKTYTLPFKKITYKLIINKDLFDACGISEIPRTWEDVRKDAAIITQKSNGKAYGYILGLQSSWTMTSYLIRPNHVNTGDTGFDHANLQYDFIKDLPMVEAILGMINDGSMFPGFEGLDADQMRAQFATGRVGMTIAASFDVSVYTEQFPADFNWVVCDIPTYEPGPSKYKDVVSNYNMYAISKNGYEKDPDKVMTVFEYLMGDETGAGLYEMGLAIPFRQEAIDMAKTQPNIKGFAEFADVPQSVVQLKDPDEVTKVEGLSYREVFLKLFARGYEEAPKEVLMDCDKRYNEGIAKLEPTVLESFRQNPNMVIERQ